MEPYPGSSVVVGLDWAMDVMVTDVVVVASLVNVCDIPLVCVSPDVVFMFTRKDIELPGAGNGFGIPFPYQDEFVRSDKANWYERAAAPNPPSASVGTSNQLEPASVDISTSKPVRSDGGLIKLQE